MLSTRERLRFGELASRVLRRDLDLEGELAKHVPLENRYSLTTTYGKSAFELAVRAADLAGSTIIMPAFISHDFVGILQKYDITPVFVDVSLDTWQLEPESIPQVHLDAATSLVVLHTFGLPARGKAMRELSDRHDLVLIEDCARAFGARGADGLVGSHGDFAAYSLSKVAPVRRGGLLVSRTPIDESLGRASNDASGVVNSVLLMKIPGMNVLEGPMYRLVRETAVYPGEIGLYEPPPIEGPESSVAVGFEAFLPSYGEVLRQKRRIGLEIRERLEPLGFRFQADPGTHIYTAIGATIPSGVDRVALRGHLRSRAINAYTLWGDPLAVSKVASDAWGTDLDAFPNARWLADNLIHFPINRFLRARDIDRLVEACTEAVGGD